MGGFIRFMSTISGALSGSSSLAALNPAEAGGTETGFLKTISLLLGNFAIEFFNKIYEMFANLIYAIGKWILVVIDFIFIFVRQIIGMNSNFDKLENISQSDLIFQFIFNESVIRVIRGMLGMAVVLLLLFCIVAIIKSEYDYAANGGSNSKQQVLVRGLKSIFLMVLVPILSIGGIILSNALLKSLYMATSGGADTSLGSQIFVSSAYNSNAYRHYADANMKRPITYNFSEITNEDNVSSWSVNGGVADLNDALVEFRKQSVWTRGLTTFLMENTNSFLTMTSVDNLDAVYEKEGKISPYHDAYDMGLFSKRVEYYVMADAVEYNIRQANTLYIKTAEEIYESYHKIIDDASIPVAARSQLPIYMPILRVNDGKNASSYEFTVQYADEDSITTYSHTAGATDEADGAVFLLAFQREVVVNDTTMYYYYPLLTAEEGFATDFVTKPDQPVIAKGMFENGTKPTAIKVEDNVVKFYRDDINIPTLLDLFPTISYETPPEGTTRDLGVEIMKFGVSAITGVDMSQFIPYVYYNVDIFSLFQKKTYNIVKIDGGMIQLDYTFDQEGVSIEQFYKMSEFNVIIFMMASVIVFGMLAKLLFGVARRVLDITLLAITYPAVLSTYPLDGGSRFGGWTKMFVNKLLSIYGVILGINIILLLVPVINGLNLITPNMIAQATQINMIPWSFTAWFANEIIEMLFIIVAFSSIEGFGRTIEHIITGEKKDNTYGVMSEGETVLNDLKALPTKVGNIVSGKFIVDAAEGAVKAVTGFIPGAAVIAEMKEKSELNKLKKPSADLEKKAKDDLKPKKGDEEKGEGEGESKKSEEANATSEASATPGGGGTEDAPTEGTDAASETAGDVGGETGAATGAVNDAQELQDIASGGSEAEDQAKAEEEVEQAQENNPVKVGKIGEDSSESPKAAAGKAADRIATDDGEKSGETTEGGENGDKGKKKTATVGSSAEAPKGGDAAASEAGAAEKPQSSQDGGDSQDTPEEAIVRTVTKEDLVDTQKIVADLRKDDYQKYIKDNGLEDNDQSKIQFANNYRISNPVGSKGYDEALDTFQVANIIHNMNKYEYDRQLVDNYAQVDSEGYEKFKNDGEMEDNDITRAKFYHSQMKAARTGGQGSEQQKKFKSNLDEVHKRMKH